MKVRNMYSTNGNKVANQFIIEGNGTVTFQSYESEIVTIDYNKRTITIGSDWNYSVTTGKYRNLFFDDYMHKLNNKKAIQALLDLTDDNNEVLFNDGYRNWIVKFM